MSAQEWQRVRQLMLGTFSPEKLSYPTPIEESLIEIPFCYVTMPSSSGLAGQISREVGLKGEHSHEVELSEPTSALRRVIYALKQIPGIKSVDLAAYCCQVVFSSINGKPFLLAYFIENDLLLGECHDDKQPVWRDVGEGVFWIAYDLETGSIHRIRMSGTY